MFGLRNNSTLTYNKGGDNIYNEGIEAITDALKTNTELRAFYLCTLWIIVNNLANKNIANNGGKAISDMLTIHPHLSGFYICILAVK